MEIKADYQAGTPPALTNEEATINMLEQMILRIRRGDTAVVKSHQNIDLEVKTDHNGEIIGRTWTVHLDVRAILRSGAQPS